MTPRSSSAGEATQKDIKAYMDYLRYRILKRPQKEESWQSDWGDSNDTPEETDPKPYDDPAEQERLRALFAYEASIEIDASGKNALRDLSDAMMALIKQDGLLATRVARAGSNAIPCRLITDAIGPPGGCYWPNLIAELNERDFRENPLRVGEEVRIPEARVTTRQFSRVVDPEFAQEGLGPTLEQFVEGRRDVAVQDLQNGTYRVTWLGYRLQIVIRGEDSVNRANAILGSVSKGLRWVTKDGFRERSSDESDPEDAKRHELVAPRVFYSPIYPGPLRDPHSQMLVCQSAPRSEAPVEADPRGIEGAYAQLVDPDFSGVCNPHGLSQSEIDQLGYGPGLASEDFEVPAHAEARAKVVLLDSGVCAHLDFGSHVEGAVACEGKAEWHGRCEFAPSESWNERKHHATHLAGLIVSQRNGEGFVGLNSDARLVSYEVPGDEDKLLNQLETWLRDDAFRNLGGVSGRRLPIFVFASEFTQQVPRRNSKGRLDRPEQRYTTQMAELIANEDFLLVVAAGQSERGKDVHEPIEVDSPRAPQNLGDLMNVLVVTGCSPNCLRNEASLDPTTDYSLKDRDSSLHLVHVAAPSMRVPSAIEMGKYIEQGGSSQAAAFTAGVAASMVGCYPRHFNRAYEVKQRIQVTSYPSLSVKQSKQIAAGVVDPFVATLHPRKDWIQNSSGPNDPKTGWIAKNFQPTEMTAWCDERIQFVDPFDPTIEPNNFNLRTNEVLRFVRYRAGDRPETPQWIVYMANSERRKFNGREPVNRKGDIIRVGPVGIGGVDPKIILGEGESATSTNLRDIEDLLLTKVVEKSDHEECHRQ